MLLRLIASLFIIMITTVPSLADSINLTVAPFAEEGSPKALAIEYLKKLLEERSSSRIQVTFEKDTDLNFATTLETLKNKQVQMAIPEISELGKTLPPLRIFELPFLFRDRQHLRRIIDSEIGMQIFQEARQSKLKPLAIWDGTSRQLLAEEAFTSPVDIPSAFFTDGYQVRTTTKSPWSEVQLTEATQQINKNKGYTLMRTHHSISSCALLVHQDFWDQLPEDMKVIIYGAVQDATLYARELADQAEKKAFKILKNDEAITLHPVSDQQRALWQQETRRSYEQTMGQEKLKIIDKITMN